MTKNQYLNKSYLEIDKGFFSFENKKIHFKKINFCKILGFYQIKLFGINKFWFIRFSQFCNC